MTIGLRYALFCAKNARFARGLATVSAEARHYLRPKRRPPISIILMDMHATALLSSLMVMLLVGADPLFALQQGLSAGTNDDYRQDTIVMYAPAAESIFSGRPGASMDERRLLGRRDATWYQSKRFDEELAPAEAQNRRRPIFVVTLLGAGAGAAAGLVLHAEAERSVWKCGVREPDCNVSPNKAQSMAIGAVAGGAAAFLVARSIFSSGRRALPSSRHGMRIEMSRVAPTAFAVTCIF